MIKYASNLNLEMINWKAVSELFNLVKWDQRTPDDIKNSFKRSSHIIIAMEKDNIIGFGRTVDDGKYYALIVDVVVHPSFQGRGIGKHVVESLKNKLKGYNFVTLTAAPKKEGFYKKMGWKKQKSSYIWPKDQQQIEQHCEPDNEVLE